MSTRADAQRQFRVMSTIARQWESGEVAALQNTRIEYVPGPVTDQIVLYLHDHPIVRYNSDGIIHFNTRGWPTSTTMRRMNDFIPSNWKIEGPIMIGNWEGQQKRWSKKWAPWRLVIKDVWLVVHEFDVEQSNGRKMMTQMFLTVGA